MPEWLYVCGGSQLVSGGLTRFFAIGGGQPHGLGSFPGAESRTRVRDAYTLAGLYVTVVENTLAGATTVESHINGAPGNQSVSIPGGATGVFQDQANTDSLVSGDEVQTRLIAGADGGIRVSLFSYILSHATDDVPVLVSASDGTTGRNTTHFIAPVGSRRGGTGEASRRYRHRLAASLARLQCFVFANGLSGASTLRLRKNGANGNQSVSIPGGSTGLFEDAANTDTVVDGDETSYEMDAGPGPSGAQITYRVLSMKAAAPGRNAGFSIDGILTSTLIVNAGETRFMPMEASSSRTVLDGTQVQARTDLEATNLFARVSANTLDGAATLAVQCNGSDTGLAVSIPAATTGVFEDSTVLAVPSSHLINCRLVAGGASGSITFTVFGYQHAGVPPPVPVGRPQNMAPKMVSAGLV